MFPVVLISCLLAVQGAFAGTIDTDFVYEPAASDVSFEGLTVYMAEVRLRTDLDKHLTNAERAAEKLGDDTPRLVGGGYNAYGMLLYKYLVTTSVEDEIAGAMRAELEELGVTISAAPTPEALTLKVTVRDLFFLLKPRTGRNEWTFEGELDLTFERSDGAVVWSGRADHDAREIKAVYTEKAILRDSNNAFSALIEATIRNNGAALQALTLASRAD